MILIFCFCYSPYPLYKYQGDWLPASFSDWLPPLPARILLLSFLNGVLARLSVVFHHSRLVIDLYWL